MPIELNALEMKRFGVVAAKVIDATATPEAIAAAARAKEVQLVTARVDVSDLPRVHSLEAAGYQLMDTLVYYRRKLEDLPPTPPLSKGVILRQAVPEDATSVAKLAQAAFTGYIGHYHADPRLNDTAADAAYVEWAETSTQRVSPDAPVLLAEMSKTVVGFLTLRRNSAEEVEIVLNAVDSANEGQGIYTALVASSLVLFKEAGIDRIITSTQVNNYTVQKVWSRLGFFHFRSFYTFHKWFDDMQTFVKKY